MTKTWFIADTHFGHAKVIDMNARPFADVVEMREAMISRWNETVRPEDEVWHLGDFAYRASADEIEATFARLQGRKRLIVGNHDGEATRALPWDSVSEMREVVVDSQRIFLCHYPMLEWPRFFRGAWHLFGHVHGNTQGVGASLDVGVDCWGYRPVSLDDVRTRLRKLGRDAVQETLDAAKLEDDR